MVFDRFTSQFLVKPVCLVVTPARTMTSWEWVAEIMALHLQKKQHVPRYLLLFKENLILAPLQGHQH
jgi:hypothetical protein